MSGDNIIKMTEALNKIAIFRSKKIRRTIYKNEWWFSVNDIIEALTDSRDPAQYFKRLKERDKELAKLTGKGGVQFVPPLMLKIDTLGGKQKTYCWHTEGVFRLIQSIPSPKAEPFKRWLARVGYERVQEIDDPELALLCHPDRSARLLARQVIASGGIPFLCLAW